MVEDEHLEDSVARLLTCPKLLCREEALSAPSPVPREGGVYAWYFSEIPPSIPTDGCQMRDGRFLLYVGIAPKETKGPATKPSERTLRCRLADHFAGNAEGSTLRLTLGCLLAERLGIQLRRVGSGKRFTFTNPGEQVLDVWLGQHARVALLPTQRPWKLEHHLLRTLRLPLNLQGNVHPFLADLKRIRSLAKHRARDLPVVADNGGLRRGLPTGSA